MLCSYYSIPYKCIVPSKLPDDILKIAELIAEVVLQYPPINILKLKPPPSWYLLLETSDKKCLTKVVELGLNKIIEPLIDISLALSIQSTYLISPVDCAKSSGELYCKVVSVSASL